MPPHQEYNAKRDKISKSAPLLDESHTYKILLCGAVRAGKSSIINTLFTAMRNDIGQIALNAEDDVSITRKVGEYLKTSISSRNC